MLDGSGNFVGVAAKELDEERKLNVAANELIDLSQMAGHFRGRFPSPGGSDETIRVFCFVRQVTEAELEDFNGRLTGNLEEGEQITLKIMPLKELWKIPDGKTIVACSQYRELEEFILLPEQSRGRSSNRFRESRMYHSRRLHQVRSVNRFSLH